MSKKTEDEENNPQDESHDITIPDGGASEDGETIVYSGDIGGFGDGGSEFDYASFDMDLDKLEAEQEQTRNDQLLENATADIDNRKTVAKRLNAQDATASVRPVGKYNVVSFQGRINESFDANAHSMLLRGSVIFDLADVDRITSFGVRGWLQMLQQSNMEEAIFIRCSEHVVNQITMIRNFCGIARIFSIHAPYMCDACGAEFNVPINSTVDKELLTGRRAPKVPCPECSATTEMDEDPWEFFSLDDHLLEKATPEFQQAMTHLTNEARYPPVEKVFTGSETRIRFNGELDQTTRFKRAFNGIEGDVIIDFNHVESITPDGEQKLVDWIVKAAPDTSSMILEGAPITLCERLVDVEADKHVKAASITAMATNGAGIHRQCLIDLALNREALLDRRPPMVDANWAQAGIELDNPEAAARIAEFLAKGPKGSTSATPAPISKVTPSPASMHSAPAPSYAAAPPVAANAEPDNSKTIMVAAFVLALVSLFMVLVAVTLIALSSQRPVAGPVIDEPVPTVQPAEPEVPIAVESDEWSTGGDQPPAWTANSVMQTETDFLFIGKGAGTSLDDATRSASDAAHLLLLSYIQQQLASSPAAVGLSQFTLPTEPSEAVSEFKKHAINLPLMIVDKNAHQTKDGQTTAFSQFSVSKVALQSLLTAHTTVAEFRGMKFAQMPPWIEGIRVLEVPSWYDVPVGAKLVTVGDQRVAKATEVPAIATIAFNILTDGQELPMTFTLDGKEHVTQFRKTVRAAAPEPVAPGGRPKLMGLDQ